ncbi:hypothetical protein [Arenibaculum pallidiluteum]|uniref:hypothetical protein n=1 Tax=Arenibaculum pallidiluteum TaxID=2812559 RepID=UPI001A95D020|nr:hypothetical protein [Arenibaculum pallidiluteum]
MGSVIPFPLARVVTGPDAANALTNRLVGRIHGEFAAIADAVGASSRALEEGLRRFGDGLGQAQEKIRRNAGFLREIQDATELAERDPEAAALLLAELRGRAEA